ncbi:MAG TPA: 16S rRNA (cytosine(967)-C(5))-methyltransferase RsmB [Rhodocyclaceae bacterium]|nr:16S rRNA (cytosine(967)-C(5))-methyltransferase RsmB [Rhodocyclaceae bacterium]
MTKIADLAEDSLAFSLLHAARTLTQVFAGQSLAEGQLNRFPAVARPAIQDFTYSTLRHFGRGDFFLAYLLERPLPSPEIHALLLVAVQRLEQRPESAHTTVDQAVRAATTIAEGRYRNLVNGVLRNFLRQQESLLASLNADPVAASAHPEWWLQTLQAAYPDAWPAIIAAGNQAPPMAVRVNRRITTRDQWLDQLRQSGGEGTPRGPDGVLLARPLPVDRLPGFFAGAVSVQDLGAQRAAEILAPHAGARVLDACAAPGGKAAHLLECSDLDLLALDLKASRCRRVEENFQRLQLQGTVRVADCLDLAQWWDGKPFDAVLADVPCTASGVVRRHPDAKWLRRPDDILSFARTQQRILSALWQVVRPGGKLLYATCSLFPPENHQQIARFLAETSTAIQCHEELLLPDAEHDGFYYCLLQKTA